MPEFSSIGDFINVRSILIFVHILAFFIALIIWSIVQGKPNLSSKTLDILGAICVWPSIILLFVLGTPAIFLYGALMHFSFGLLPFVTSTFFFLSGRLFGKAIFETRHKT